MGTVSGSPFVWYARLKRAAWISRAPADAVHTPLHTHQLNACRCTRHRGAPIRARPKRTLRLHAGHASARQPVPVAWRQLISPRAKHATAEQFVSSNTSYRHINCVRLCESESIKRDFVDVATGSGDCTTTSGEITLSATNKSIRINYTTTLTWCFCRLRAYTHIVRATTLI